MPQFAFNVLCLKALIEIREKTINLHTIVLLYKPKWVTYANFGKKLCKFLSPYWLMN